jgi:hypothetical protein
VSEENIRKQINHCKKEISRINKGYSDKKYRSKQEIENKFNTEINELKLRIRALTKNDDKGKKERKNLNKEISRLKKAKSVALKKRLKENKKEKKSQINKIKDEIKALQTMLNTMRRPKIARRYI